MSSCPFLINCLLILPGFVLTNAVLPIEGLSQEVPLLSPSGIALDNLGNVYIADRSGQTIIKMDSGNPIPKVVVGTGENGYNGDGPGSEVLISNPELITCDSRGNLIFTDRSNSRVRRLNIVNGLVETLAGTGEPGYSGDGGPAVNAQLSYPFGIACDTNDNIYIADTENHAIRKIDKQTGLISTIAGNGSAGFSGDGGISTQASFNRPHVITVDDEGNVFVGDSGNQRIRKINQETGKIITLFGIGEQGFSEDGINARNAKFGYFGTILLCPGKLIFSEWINKRIRIIDMQTGLLESLKDTEGKVIEISGPYGLATDTHGNYYVSEVNKKRILKISPEGIMSVFFKP